MPENASCPSCGGPIDNTSIEAHAPRCAYCRVPIRIIDATLGLISPYGIDDPNITRSRVEADIAVFRSYKVNCLGMLENCKRQLNKGVEQYAKLPNPPELLGVQEVPPFWKGLGKGLLAIPVWFLAVLAAWIVLELIGGIVGLFYNIFTGKHLLWIPEWSCWLVIIPGWVVSILYGPVMHFRAEAANGSRPTENARRQKGYEEAVAAALKAAEPVKAREDHLRKQEIAKLTAQINSYSEKEAAL